VILLGGRMSEMPSSGYTLIDIPYPQQRWSMSIPIHPNSAASTAPDLAISASPQDFVAALADLEAPAQPHQGRAHRRHASGLPPGRHRRGPAPAMSTWGRSWSGSRPIRPDTIFTNGAGNYATWLHRFHRFRQFNTQAAPTSGSMGYSLPAAVAAKRLFPDREVICFAGDGCFLMHGQEFATAVRYNLPIIAS
jgi:acetolactate synthase-1/2/3 large subunit